MKYQIGLGVSVAFLASLGFCAQAQAQAPGSSHEFKHDHAPGAVSAGPSHAAPTTQPPVVQAGAGQSPHGLQATPPPGGAGVAQRGAMPPPPPPGPQGGPLPPPQHFDPAAIAARNQAQEDQRDRERRERIRNEREWEASREARAEAHRREIAERWAAIAIRAEARAELQLHAERMAHLSRILDVAFESHDDSLVAHCRRVIQREIARNARAMARIEAGGGR
jgi:hypothetical protein